MVNFIGKWPDKDYAELEDKICNLVRSLHGLRIMTVMSCDGHIRTSPIYVGVLPYPWIVIQVTPEEMNELMRRISSWNELYPTKRWTLSQARVHRSFTPEYIKSVMIRDNPGTLVTAFCPEEENLKLSNDVLMGLRAQSDDLAHFLKEPS